MKFRKSLLTGILAGSLGFAPAMTSAQVMPDYDNRKSIEDDSSLTPAVPGVTDDHGNGLDMSSEDVRDWNRHSLTAGTIRA